MPAPQAYGRYSAADVQSAQDLVRNYLLSTATSTAVLKQHDFSIPLALIEPDQQQDVDFARRTISTLAEGNDLVAPIRALASVSDSAVAATSSEAEHLHLDINVVWAYALRADYAVSTNSSGVVTVHEQASIDVHFRPGDRPKAIQLTDDSRAFSGMDCGYGKSNLIALERAADPQGVVASRPAADPYALDSPLSEVVGCQS